MRCGGDQGEILARLAAERGGRAQCAAPAAGPVEGLGDAAIAQCTLTAEQIGYRVYAYARGRTVYVAEGLEGYDSALRLGLRARWWRTMPCPAASRRRPSPSPIPPPSPACRPARWIRRRRCHRGLSCSNAGSYAEAAEFFDVLLARANAGGEPMTGEYLANRALQRSNLGEFAEADALFAGMERLPTADPVQLRLRRNFTALHLLNQHRADAVLAVLDRPVAAVARRASRLRPARTPRIDAVKKKNSLPS